MNYANQTPSANQTPTSYGGSARRAAERSDRPDDQAARRAAERSDRQYDREALREAARYGRQYDQTARRAAERSDRRYDQAAHRAAERSDAAAGSTARAGNTRGSSGFERYDRPAYTATNTARPPARTRSTAVERTDRPSRGTGWLIPLLLVLLIAAILFAVFGRGGDDQVQDYYVSVQQDPEPADEPGLPVAAEPVQSNETPLKDVFVFDEIGREKSDIIDYFRFDDQTVTDSYGNSYHGYFEMLCYGAGGGMDSFSTWATLLANGEYSRFTGTIFAEPDMSSDYSVQFLVFADGAQVYDSGFLTRNDPAVSFDIDVSGAQQVKIQAYSSDYSTFNTNPRVYLVDAAFHR